MFSRCKHLSPLQRKTLLFMSGAMMLTILTNFSDRHTVNPLKDIFPALGQLQTGHPAPYWRAFFRRWLCFQCS